MRLYKRPNSPYWYATFIRADGRRARISTGTESKQAAQELAAQAAADSWRQRKLGERPLILWDQAVLQWLAEHGDQRKSLETIKDRLRWLTQHLTGTPVASIDAKRVRELKALKLAEPVRLGGRATTKRAAPGTVNRMLSELRKILRYCHRQEWIDRIPHVDAMPEPKGDFRWLTRDEAGRLIAELPAHLASMAAFALATGLRAENVQGLEWRRVDLARRCAWIQGGQAKGGKPIAVPLNQDALHILARQQGAHPRWVFVYRPAAKGGHQGAPEPIRARLTTKAWKKAVERAGIEPCTFHDLRHTWASWHIQAGTPLKVLQELGAWSNLEMVQIYAHLAPGYVADYAGNSEWLKNDTLPALPAANVAADSAGLPDQSGIYNGVADRDRTDDNWNHKMQHPGAGNVSALIYLASHRKKVA